jgi:hypothetical protein
MSLIYERCLAVRPDHEIAGVCLKCWPKYIQEKLDDILND